MSSMKYLLLAALCLSVVLPIGARKFFKASGECPAISTIDTLDLDRFIEKSWFVQKQQLNSYQSKNDLFCTTATYNREENSDFILVTNYANKDKVNGQYTNNTNFLCGKQQKGGKLGVAPCFLRKIFIWSLVQGPYWVVHLDQENYQWAVVLGGQPDQKKNDNPVQCSTKTKSDHWWNFNGSNQGFWIFSREQKADPKLIEKIEKDLQGMGLYTGDLIDVTQEGCNYEGNPLKL